jgi:hypothetical protein
VTLAAVVSVAKLGEHSICGWFAETVPAEVSDDGRLPSAIDTAPPIALEAENPQSAMVRLVSAVTAGATAFVMFTLSDAAVLFARTAGSQFGTARGRAGAQDPPHPTGLLVGCHAHLGISLRSGQISMCRATVMLRVDHGFSPHLLVLWLYSSRLRFQARL